MIKLSRGLKKHIRRQKSKIRKEVGDFLEQERLIQELVSRIRTNYKRIDANTNEENKK